ncbi:MAG: ATP-dependent sacrificial sulfur transferase LarE, partial [Deltaproteobacteria bacterium]|nr:ATP-dependent sacrificial sulfur transferase LarE [Deltaproteobacteria bacterium]
MEKKITRLKDFIRNCGRVAVAYSGGIDSSLVLKLCIDVLGRKNVLAVTGRSETFTNVELEEARKFARAVGARLIVITTREIDNPDFRSNPPSRCYHCKKEFYSMLSELAAKRGFSCIFDGSNSNDLLDYRPGRKAVEEFGIISPLIKFGLDKAEVRKAAKKMGLAIWD